MKKTIIPILALGLLILFSGCPNSNKFNYTEGVFPEFPVNFIDVNTPYDDYNSALPELHLGRNLIFSSNRKTQGGNFDNVGEDLHITWYMENGELLIDDTYGWIDKDYVTPLLQRLNTSGNEFGPYALGYYQYSKSRASKRINLITYSSNDSSDTYRSRMVYHETINGGDSTNVFGPFDLKIINNNSNPQYVSFFGKDAKTINIGYFEPHNLTQMYFQADVDGQTDIFTIDIPENDNFIAFLTSDTTYPAQKIERLSTSSNDKCPFINGHVLVFTSDRPGGFGGYDLYYSIYENGIWGPAINFGEKINSTSDEFRPVTVSATGFKTDLMIFSSNRPEGQGGYDLYYVGLPFKIFDWDYIED